MCEEDDWLLLSLSAHKHPCNQIDHITSGSAWTRSSSTTNDVAWSCRPSCETPDNLSVLASYPTVKTRALGSWRGCKSCSHRILLSLSVQDFSRCPLRLCTAMMLCGKLERYRSEKKRDTHSITGLCPGNSSFNPKASHLVSTFWSYLDKATWSYNRHDSEGLTGLFLAGLNRSFRLFSFAFISILVVV